MGTAEEGIGIAVIVWVVSMIIWADFETKQQIKEDEERRN